MVRRAVAPAVVWALAACGASAACAEPQPFPVGAGITIGVQRLAARTDAPGTPIYFVAGGPGVSPFEELARRPRLFEQLRALGEVVLVEQRGAGTSRPPMDCATHWALPLDRAPTRTEVIADARRQFRQCAHALRTAGVDLAAYRTEAYAADLLAVMRALGHQRVRLLAHSYGTMIALELLRHDEGRIERAVLAGAMGPGDALRDPAHHERVLARLAVNLGVDPTALRERTAAALAQVRQEPLPVALDDGTVVVLGGDDVARNVVQTMGRPSQASVLVEVTRALALRGADAPWSPPAEVTEWLQAAARDTLKDRRGPLARRAAAQHYLTVCANGVPAERVYARAAASLFGPILHAALPEACDAWGLPATAVRPPVRAPTPLLLVSALLDVRTPHEQALALVAGLPDAAVLTLSGAGHGEVLEAPGVLGDDLWSQVQGFLRGEAVASQTLSHEARAGR